jgi:hypothetical protein
VGDFPLVEEESVVRIVCSRFLAVVAFGVLPIALGGLSGCNWKPADGMLDEPPHIDATQKEEVKGQYQKQRLERQSKYSIKGKGARLKPKG